jgi:hypothetical protein
MFTA